jgi:hypothetical protein
MEHAQTGKATGPVSDEELAAAQAVQRVLGGTWERHDTGGKPGLFDVLHTLDDGRRIALEVTSEGSRHVDEARKAIGKRFDRDDFAGASLSWQWHLHVDANTRISALRPSDIEATLRDFEAKGIVSVSARANGDPDQRSLWRLGVESALRWDANPPSDRPRILLAPSFSVIGQNTSLGEALARVLARFDNQKKLAASDADERHLYVFLEDRAAATGLRGLWALPSCPPDPSGGVIDTVWIYAPWGASGVLHRVVPGTDEWEHFDIATGEPVAESALSER